MWLHSTGLLSIFHFRCLTCLILVMTVEILKCASPLFLLVAGADFHSRPIRTLKAYLYDHRSDVPQKNKKVLQEENMINLMTDCKSSYNVIFNVSFEKPEPANVYVLERFSGSHPDMTEHQSFD